MEDDAPAINVGEVTLDEDYGQGGVDRKDHKLPQLHEGYVPKFRDISELCLTIMSKYNTKIC